MDTLETALMSVLWNIILDEFAAKAKEVSSASDYSTPANSTLGWGRVISCGAARQRHISCWNFLSKSQSVADSTTGEELTINIDF